MYLNINRLQNIYYLYLTSKECSKMILEEYLYTKYKFSEYQIKRFLKFVHQSPLAARVELFVEEEVDECRFRSLI